MTRRLGRSPWGLLLTIALVSVAGCPDVGPPPVNITPGLQAVYIVAAAAHPTALATLPDGRVLYTEKETGQIRVIKDGELLPAPLATVPVNYAGDQGLLGIAVHPQFNLNGRVYVFYTRSSTGQPTNAPAAVIDNRIVYFEVDGDVAPAGEVFVAAVPAIGTERVGGRLAFDRDARLYVAVGDQRNPAAATDDSSLLGKVLRYRDDGTAPVGNIAEGSPIYARGLRFPQGLTVDPESELLFFTDQNATGEHEINRLAGDAHYGWPSVTGFATTAAEREFAAAHPEYLNPILDSGGDASPYIGAAFNPSTKYGLSSELRLFHGVRDTGYVNAVQLTAERLAATDTNVFGTGFPTPVTDVMFTPSGTLWVASRGAVLRVDVFVP